MRVLMIAPPGAGKGTQGALIATHFDIPHIATGELLRDHVARRTALGLAVQEYLDRGELVPDQVVLDMLREELIAAKAAGGAFVLDGIPRNMHQARAVYLIGRELGMTADVALHLQADDEELMRRLLARAALEHRSDDTTDIIAQRLALYHAVTSPIVSWYRDRGILVSLDAMRSAQQVGREILTALEAMRPFLDHVPGQTRLSVDLTGLGDAFGAADSTAGTSDLADGLHRRPPRLVGAGWLDRARGGVLVAVCPDGLLRAVRGVVASGAGGCGRWPAQAGLMCRGVRRRLAAGSAASAVREPVTASVTVAWYSRRMATRRATWRATWAGACRRSGERWRAACRAAPSVSCSRRLQRRHSALVTRSGSGQARLASILARAAGLEWAGPPVPAQFSVNDLKQYR